MISNSISFPRGDTHLTINDAVDDSVLKVDLRIINDKLVQRYNEETEVSMAEVSKESPGDKKFHSDRCKVNVENKVVIDRFLDDLCNIDSVDSIQICGLEIFIINLSLGAPGVYVGTELFHSSIDSSLCSFSKYFDLAVQLLCFRIC